jgi:hypothetical protein
MITWVDGTRFLFASGAGEARELRLGTIGGASLRVGEFKGDGAMYDFNNPR